MAGGGSTQQGGGSEQGAGPELELHALTFDELVDRIREPLEQLEVEAALGNLEPAAADFYRSMRAALGRYDQAEPELGEPDA